MNTAWANAGVLLGLIHDRLPNCHLSLEPGFNGLVAIRAVLRTNKQVLSSSRHYSLHDLEYNRTPLDMQADHFVHVSGATFAEAKP